MFRSGLCALFVFTGSVNADVWKILDRANVVGAQAFHRACDPYPAAEACAKCKAYGSGDLRTSQIEVICRGGEIGENAYLAAQAEKRLPDLRCAHKQAEEIYAEASKQSMFSDKVAEALQKLLDLRRATARLNEQITRLAEQGRADMSDPAFREIMEQGEMNRAILGEEKILEGIPFIKTNAVKELIRTELAKFGDDHGPEISYDVLLKSVGRRSQETFRQLRTELGGNVGEYERAVASQGSSLSRQTKEVLAQDLDLSAKKDPLLCQIDAKYGSGAKRRDTAFLVVDVGLAVLSVVDGGLTAPGVLSAATRLALQSHRALRGFRIAADAATFAAGVPSFASLVSSRCAQYQPQYSARADQTCTAADVKSLDANTCARDAALSGLGLGTLLGKYLIKTPGLAKRWESPPDTPAPRLEEKLPPRMADPPEPRPVEPASITPPPPRKIETAEVHWGPKGTSSVTATRRKQIEEVREAAKEALSYNAKDRAEAIASFFADHRIVPPNGVIHVVGPGGNAEEWALALMARSDVHIVVSEAPSLTLRLAQNLKDPKVLRKIWRELTLNPSYQKVMEQSKIKRFADFEREVNQRMSINAGFEHNTYQQSLGVVLPKDGSKDVPKADLIIMQQVNFLQKDQGYTRLVRQESEAQGVDKMIRDQIKPGSGIVWAISDGEGFTQRLGHAMDNVPRVSLPPDELYFDPQKLRLDTVLQTDDYERHHNALLFP